MDRARARAQPLRRTGDGLSGFDTSSLLSFAIAPTQNGYSEADASRLVRRLDEQIRGLPVASSSAAARYAFLNDYAWSNSVTMQTDRRTVTEQHLLGGGDEGTAVIRRRD